MLMNMKDLLAVAHANYFAVPAFNISSSMLLTGAMEASEEKQSPVILAIHPDELSFVGTAFVAAAVAEANKASVPVCIHLDHGDTFEICKQCVEDGFTSVMIDASHQPYEENVKLTRQVVEYAHSRGVVVEAELGQLGGIEEHVKGVDDVSAHLTDPDQAVDFIKRSGCDSLALAIGTSHGAYKFKAAPKLAFDVIERIHKLVPGYPLVMHGSSSVLQEFKDLINKYGGKMPDAMGVPEEAITRASKMGVCKVNIDTDLRMALTAKIRQVFAEKPGEFDPRKYLGPGREAIKKMVKHKLHVLGCAGKAGECL